MKYVSTAEAKRALDDVLESAQREPITIRCEDRDIAVVLSPEAFERMTADNVARFQRFCDDVAARAAKRGMTEEKLADILADEE